MKILSKQSWIVLGQVSAAFTAIIILAVLFLDAPNLKEGMLMLCWSISGAFVALKLQTLHT